MDDPSYELKVKQTLTIKPDEFYIHAIPRKDKSRLLSVPASALAPAVAGAGKSQNVNGRGTSTTADASDMQPLFILYGSNTGSSKSFAERLASDAPTHGMSRGVSPLANRVDQDDQRY